MNRYHSFPQIEGNKTSSLCHQPWLSALSEYCYYSIFNKAKKKITIYKTFVLFLRDDSLVAAGDGGNISMLWRLGRRVWMIGISARLLEEMRRRTRNEDVS